MVPALVLFARVACFIGAGVLSGLVWVGSVIAVEYPVQIDRWSESPTIPGAHEASYTPVTVDREFEVFTPWWSAYKNPGAVKGSKITNATSKTIVALHIRVVDPAHDTFQLDMTTVDRFCTEVWKKSDNTEIIFNGTQIGQNDAWWMLVSKRTVPNKVFDGILSERILPVPTGGAWENVYSVQGPEGTYERQLWHRMVATLPLKYRDIGAHSETVDGKLLFVSNNQLFLYDDGPREVRYVVTDDTTPAGINRIATDNATKVERAFVLFVNGFVVGKVPLGNPNLGGRLGRYPGEERP
jgi:hypothetical protein